MERRSESGQAIVLLVFAVIGLIGFTALAIDGGMLYSDRRHANSVSDAASLAGGGFAALSLENYSIDEKAFDCSNPDLNPNNTNPNSLVNKAITVATNRALSNDYSNAEINITVVCEDDSTGPDKKYLEIITTITRQTNTALIHFAYAGPAVNQVQTTVRIRPQTPFAMGYAVVALNPANCQGQQNGATFHGNADIDIVGGGIWTNGCLRGNGTPDVWTDGGIDYVGQLIGGHLFHPTPQQKFDLIPVESYTLDPLPNCGHPEAHMVDASEIVGELEGGLYCVSGEIKINGNDEVHGSGVTLYLLNAGIKINGNAYVDLTAPAPGSNSAPAIPGFLFITAPGNSSRIQINGNSESYFEGTILVVESDIDFLGNGNTDSYNTQIIGWNVQVGGNSDTNVDYYDNGEDGFPSTIDLSE